MPWKVFSLILLCSKTVLFWFQPFRSLLVLAMAHHMVWVSVAHAVERLCPWQWLQCAEAVRSRGPAAVLICHFVRTVQACVWFACVCISFQLRSILFPITGVRLRSDAAPSLLVGPDARSSCLPGTVHPGVVLPGRCYPVLCFLSGLEKNLHSAFHRQFGSSCAP